MEILSPVGSLSSLYAAVRSGADAVYFGVGEFNARRNAENFEISDLKNISSYCHIRGVKAYLALNTLINDDEFSNAIKLVSSACEAGIDAIIINDIGLADIIKKSAPNMPLHASTQMTVHNVEGVKYLKEKGFSRVVLARENSLNEIKSIAEYANQNSIELEIFVQGAHCMSISGQCLLSAVLGSRSGNRGLCAQPCRLPFSVTNKVSYDLSLKDMNLFEHFDEFEKLNISSLKIEGRMKSEEYVAAATYSAKCFKENAADKYESLNILKDVFSRSGFTDGYLCEKIDKNMFGVRSEQDIEKSKQVKNSIHNLYRRERQSVKVNFYAEFLQDKPSVLTVCDEINKITVTGEIPQTAQNKPTDKESIINKLSKTGSTPYYVENIDVKIDNDLFISLGSVSSLKEKALKELTEIRAKIIPVPFYYDEKTNVYNKFDSKCELFVSVHNLNQIPDNYNADIIFIPMSSDLKKVSNLINKGYNIGIKTPVFFNNLSDEKLKLFKEIGVEHALMQNIGAYNQLKKHGYIITAAHSMNIFNSISLQNSPADYCTVSAELTLEQVKKLNSDKPKGIYAYGKLPLMILKNCPIKANLGCENCTNSITDRKNIDFNIFCEDGVTKLTNNRPIYLADKKDFLSSLDFIMLDFTDESADEIKFVTNLYKNGGEYNKEFTRGLYFKGVL